MRNVFAPVALEHRGFLNLDLSAESFDAVVAADTFEHIPLELEVPFRQKCAALLKPDGVLIVTVPHRGTWAFLDVYNIKPLVHFVLWRLRLRRETHNGFCDIRKGHKHYTRGELKLLGAPLKCAEQIIPRSVFVSIIEVVQTLREVNVPLRQSQKGGIA